jgi:hypothetical protein
MELDQVRAFSLGLPGTSEQPHFDKASYRVDTKIFVTVPPDAAHVHVLVTEEQARAAVQESPALELLPWGAKVAGVRVRLADAPADLVLELVEDAWRRKAPARLIAELDADGI